MTSRGDAYARWVRLIIDLRKTHDVGILEAERIALGNRHRRRWVEMAINTHKACRKQALAHIELHGSASLIERKGETFAFHIR
jgi:hypothetical protein